jgi:hypothetical protein
LSNFAKHHDELKKVMESYKDKELATSSIKSIFSEKLPKLDAAWLHPSDHCNNHTCKGSCECSKTENAIFSRVSRGLYLVL